MKILTLTQLVVGTLLVVACNSNGGNSSETRNESENEIAVDGQKTEAKETSSKGFSRDGVGIDPKSDVSGEQSGKQTSDEDWNAFLDSYESLVESYVACMKKYKAGDVSAMTEYAAVLEKVQDYSEKLSRVQNNLQPEQEKRYLEITEKMTQTVY